MNISTLISTVKYHNIATSKRQYSHCYSMALGTPMGVPKRRRGGGRGGREGGGGVKGREREI